MTTADLTECPRCESPEVRHVWCAGRMLRWECMECWWKSEPHKPDQRRVKTTRPYPRPGIGGWTFEGYDGYGHAFVSSQGYDSESECLEAARKELDKMKKYPEYGKCTIVMWPPSVVVKGKVMR